MSIFTTSRKAFLDFLRNLSPQILLLSIALVASLQLDVHKYTGEKVGVTLFFFALLAVFVAATFANLFEFLDSASAKQTDTIKPIATIEQTPEPKPLSLRGRLKVLFRTHKWLFFEIVISVAVVEVCLVAVFWAAITGAASTSNLFHKSETVVTTQPSDIYSQLKTTHISASGQRVTVDPFNRAHEPEAKPSSFIETVNAASTTIVALFTFFLWWSTRNLWIEARDSGVTARKAANAAEVGAAAAKASADAVMLSERAYIAASVKHPGVDWGKGSDFKIALTIKNCGRTPATISDVSINARVLDNSNELDLKCIPSKINPNVFLVPQDSFPYDQHFMLSENDVNDIKSGSKTLWIFGHVDYIDTFKIRHRAGFARVYTSALDGGSRNNLSYAVEGSNRYNYDDLRKEGDGKDWT